MTHHLGSRRRPATRRTAAVLVLVVVVALAAWWVIASPGSAPASAPRATTTTAAATMAPPSPTPTPLDTTPLAASAPTRVRIRSIGVDSSLVRLGLTKSHTLEVPPGPRPAGWYTGAPTPGEIGPAVIVGHVAFNGIAGVFAKLHDVHPGDQVDVSRKDGSTATFRVTHVSDFKKSKFPTALVYGDLDHAGLRLITCGGLDQASHVYEDNLVVLADLVGST